MMSTTKEALAQRFFLEHEGGASVDLLSEAKRFLEDAAQIAESNPRSPGEADKLVLKFVFSYSRQEGMQILRTAHAIIPEHEVSSHNPDHDHAVYYRNRLYLPKEGPEVIVTRLPGSSISSLKLHRHPSTVIEYKASYQSGLVVVKESFEGLEEEIVLSPRQVYGSREGEFHSIRNCAPYGIFSFDILVLLRQDPTADMARLHQGTRLPISP